MPLSPPSIPPSPCFSHTHHPFPKHLFTTQPTTSSSFHLKSLATASRDMAAGQPPTLLLHNEAISWFESCLSRQKLILGATRVTNICSVHHLRDKHQSRPWMLLSHTIIKPSVGMQGIKADRGGQRNEIVSFEFSQLNKSKTRSDLLRKKAKKMEKSKKDGRNLI